MEPLEQHGVDGWSLEDYCWDERTGRARLVYERTLPGAELERVIVVRAQPASPSHEGWRTWTYPRRPA